MTSPAACTPPVRAKTGCCSRSRSGQPAYDVGARAAVRSSAAQPDAASAAVDAVLAADPARRRARRLADVPVAGGRAAGGADEGDRDDVELLLGARSASVQ